MKQWLMVIGWMAFGYSISAQTFSEWFRQHKTQIKYLHQQIAALGALTDVIEDGYGIIGEGTDTIGRVLQKDQDQHAAYFASLRDVKPAIEKDYRIPLIHGWRQLIAEQGRACRKAAMTGNWLVKDEQVLVAQRTDDWDKRAEVYVQVMDRVVTNGYWSMTDDERLQRIGEIYGTMKQLVSAAVDFYNLVEQVTIYRQRLMKEAEGMELLYGIKNQL